MAINYANYLSHDSKIVGGGVLDFGAAGCYLARWIVMTQCDVNKRHTEIDDSFG